MPEISCPFRIAATLVVAMAASTWGPSAMAQSKIGNAIESIAPGTPDNPITEAAPASAAELLGDGVETLGEMIRDRSSDVNSLDASVGRNPATLSSSAREYDQPFENEVLSAAASRERLVETHVRELRKPMVQIRVQPREETETVPENRAARFTVESPLLEITSAGLTPPLPDRYTICQTHRPLFYEQPLLERCGRGFGCLQNAISGAQFCVNTVFLPYHMCDEHADCPVPSGGDCLSCQPYALDCNPLPISCPAMTTQAAALAGFTFLLL